MPNGEWQDTCPLYPASKEDGGHYWLELSMTYAAYDKGILPEPGGLGDQPAMYSFLMGTISSAINAERQLQQEEDAKANKKGKQSPTEQYLNARGADNPLINPKSNVNPNSPAAVPGLLVPRKTIKRG